MPSKQTSTLDPVRFRAQETFLRALARTLGLSDEEPARAVQQRVREIADALSALAVKTGTPGRIEIPGVGRTVEYANVKEDLPRTIGLWHRQKMQPQSFYKLVGCCARYQIEMPGAFGDRNALGDFFGKQAVALGFKQDIVAKIFLTTAEAPPVAKLNATGGLNGVSDFPESTLMIPSSRSHDHYRAFEEQNKGYYWLYARRGKRIVRELMSINRYDRESHTIRGRILGFTDTRADHIQEWDTLGMATSHVIILHVWTPAAEGYVSHSTLRVARHETAPMDVEVGLQMGATDSGRQLYAFPILMERIAAPPAEWSLERPKEWRDQVVARNNEAVCVLDRKDAGYATLRELFLSSPVASDRVSNLLEIDDAAVRERAKRGLRSAKAVRAPGKRPKPRPK